MYIEEKEELMKVRTDLPRPLRNASSEMFLSPHIEEARFPQKTTSLSDIQVKFHIPQKLKKISTPKLIPIIVIKIDGLGITVQYNAVMHLGGADGTANSFSRDNTAPLGAAWPQGYKTFYYAPEGTSGGILKSHHPSVLLSVRQSVRPLQIVSQRYLINY